MRQPTHREHHATRFPRAITLRPPARPAWVSSLRSSPRPSPLRGSWGWPPTPPSTIDDRRPAGRQVGRLRREAAWLRQDGPWGLGYRWRPQLLLHGLRPRGGLPPSPQPGAGVRSLRSHAARPRPAAGGRGAVAAVLPPPPAPLSRGVGSGRGAAPPPPPRLCDVLLCVDTGRSVDVSSIYALCKDVVSTPQPGRLGRKDGPP